MAGEANLENRCRKYAQQRGGELLKFKSPGNKGIHDRILLMPKGFVAFVEFKNPNKRGRMEPLQEYWQKRFTQLEIRTYIIDSFSDFKALCP